VAWQNSYWDAIEEIYWEPSLLGLQSIPKKLRRESDQFILIPKDALAKGGSVYTRPDTGANNFARLKRLEVPLNHIFDICFSIAPSSVIESIFLKPAGLSDRGRFTRLGREISSRYDGYADNTATQQDGFFVSQSTLLGTELKVDAPTSADQLLKYVALMMAEERFSWKRHQLLIAFVTPDNSAQRCFERCGIDGDGSIPPDYLEKFEENKLSRVVRNALATDKAHFLECLARLNVFHISWKQLAEACEQLASDARSVGGLAEAVDCLLTGMAEAIRSNPNTSST
jgi:hypothetical protein